MQMEYCRVILKSSWWVTVVLHVPSMDCTQSRNINIAWNNITWCVCLVKDQNHTVSLYISHYKKCNISLFYSYYCFNLPNDELHLASASSVHEDRNQLWVTGAKNAVRPDGNGEKTLLLITCLKH